jgi:hypothetical protein
VQSGLGFPEDHLIQVFLGRLEGNGLARKGDPRQDRVELSERGEQRRRLNPYSEDSDGWEEPGKILQEVPIHSEAETVSCLCSLLFVCLCVLAVLGIKEPRNSHLLSPTSPLSYIPSPAACF